MSTIAELPNEMILEISRHLDRKSLSRLSQTCKIINSLLQTTLAKAAKADSSRLPHAIKHGHTTAVRGYLKAGVDPNFSTPSGVRMLNIAVRNNHYDIMCDLLAHGADPSLSDVSSSSILVSQAITAKDHLIKDTMVQRLLTAGANISEQGTIHEIARYCNLDTLKLAKLHGANFHKRDAFGSSILDSIMDDYITMLNHDRYMGRDTSGSSLMRDDRDKLDYILHEAGDLIFAVDGNNEVPLFTAIRIGDQDFSCSLCEAYLKSDPDLLAISNRNGETVLHLAISHGMEHLFIMLIKSGISLHNVVGLDTALRYVMNSHSVPILGYLIEAGTNVGRVNEDNETPLFAAIRTRDQKFACTICDVYLKSDPSLLAIRNNKGDTVLHLAIDHGMVKLFTILIKSGISLHNVVGLDTALRYTMHSFSVPILRHLIEAGADVNCRVTWGSYTPLWVAVSCEKLAIVKILVEIGNANLNAAGSEDTFGYGSQTPLQLAVENRSWRIAEYLRSKGAK